MTIFDSPEIDGVRFQWDSALKCWISEPVKAIPISVHQGIYAFRDAATGDLVCDSDFERIAIASIRAFRLMREKWQP